jgi:tetratricopeptide (TPR) repeat protein
VTAVSRDAAWSSKRDALRAALQEDLDAGVTAWVDALSDALLARDLAAYDHLVSDALPLPADVSPLLEKTLRPALVAWRAGRTADAARSLSAGSAVAGPVVADLLAGAFERASRDVKVASTEVVKAAWLEAAGRTQASAGAALEAGKRYSWQGESNQQLAIELLTHAIDLDASLVPAYWYLAEAWRVRSATPQPPYADREPLERSLAIWNAGAARKLPDAPASWAYVTRALICEQQARLDEGRRTELWWEAICYIERAILLDDSDSGCWAALGRIHNQLENESCALHATAEAVRRGPEDPGALEERAALLADTGRFDEAIRVIEQRLAQDSSNVWARSVKAYVLAYQKKPEAALELIDGVIALDPGSIWNLDLRAVCCRMVNDRAEVLATAQRIRALQRETPTVRTEERAACAYAAYTLGFADEAIAQLEQLSGDVAVRADVRRILGLCHFVKGRIVRGEELLLSGLARAQAHELDAFLNLDLKDLETRAHEWRGFPGAVAALNRVKKTAAAVIAGLSRAAADDLRALAVGELTGVAGVGADDWTSPAALGAQAGLARLMLERRQWREAAQAYRALQLPDQRLPEAGLGVERALEGLRGDARNKAGANDVAAASELFRQLLDLQTDLSRRDQLSPLHEEIGDMLWRTGATGAYEHFKEALALASGEESHERLGRLRVRLALACQQQGDLSGARTHSLEALQLFAEAGTDAAGNALSASALPLIRDIAHFWAVDAFWATLAQDAAVPGGGHRALDAARTSALTYLSDFFGLSRHNDPAVVVPFVKPISLDVGSGLVPFVDPKSDGGKFLYKEIPAMRDAIRRSMGVETPGINVREDPSSSDRYSILLGEVPSGSGSVSVGSRYALVSRAVLADAGVTGAGGTEAIDPVSGGMGLWCSPAQAEALTKRGIPASSEMQFVLAHVDLLLRRHLDGFLGVQEVQNLVGGQTLGDDRFLVFFARVLRALAREQVPITEWKEILETVRGLDSRKVEEAVSRVRLTRRQTLPGNQEPVAYVEVAAEWRDRISRDQRTIDISSADAHRLLAEIGRNLEAQAGAVTLVTATPALRVFVRRLVQLQFPAIAVLARDEVMPQPRLDPVERTRVESSP